MSEKDKDKHAQTIRTTVQDHFKKWSCFVFASYLEAK